jgi:hypothetical protein
MNIGHFSSSSKCYKSTYETVAPLCEDFTCYQGVATDLPTNVVSA